MGNKRYKNFSRRVNEILDIPPEADSDVVKITAVYNDDILVQNFGRVYEYTDCCASFLSKELLIEITGRDLSLSSLSAFAVRVIGQVDSISYKRVGE